MMFTQIVRDQGLIPHRGTNPLWHLVANVNPRLEVYSISARTCFFLGGVNVMVSWGSSSYDACPDSERPRFDPQLRHQCFNPLWQFDYLIFILETCPRLILRNGQVTYNQTALEGRYPAGTDARFECDYLYHRVGAFRRICQASGNF